MTTVATPILIDRADVHKSCKSLEIIVSVLSNYTEAANALAVVQKKLAKTLREAASVKGTNNVPANAMMNCAGVFEALAEVDSKFAKLADQEAENVGGELKKWFKKLAKEEKAHDERITNANARIKQAGQAYEKKAKKKDRDAVDEHARYVAILNSIGPEMSQDKHNHCLLVTQRHTMAVSACAATLSRLAEAEWARACESVRRSAPGIGYVGEWRALCEAGWSSPLPNDLPDLGARESHRDGKITEATGKTTTATRKLIPPPAPSFNDSAESLASPSVARSSQSIGRLSETNSATEQANSQSLPSRPQSPLSVSEPIPSISRKTPIRSDSANVATAPPMPQTTSSEGTGPPEPLLPAAPATAVLSSPEDGEVRSPLPPISERDTSADLRTASDPDGTLKPEPKSSHPQPSHDLAALLTSRESLSVERGQTQRSEPLSERDQKSPSPSPVTHKVTNRPVRTGLDRRLSVESTTSNASLVAAMRDHYDTRPIKPASPPPRDLPRLTQSVTDLATRYTPLDAPTPPRRGLAAERFPTFQDRYPRSTLDRERDRDRYRIPPETAAQDRDRYQIPPEALTPERDRHRISPDVTPDRRTPPEVLALERDRYNIPSDVPASYRDRHKIHPEGPMFDRDQYGRSPDAALDRDQYTLPRMPVPERDYLIEHDSDRYHEPTSVATTNRHRFLRDDRAKYRAQSPDRLYVDEMGMRDRARRIDPVEEERALQEREDQLRERERQLNIERSRLMNPREAEYGSDTGGRSPRSASGDPRLTESPTPMSSQQSLSLRPPPPTLPYDHSPSCGCERCSARHYATSQSLSRGPEKPEPPIQLRPEKPKNWIRRMSTPVTSFIAPSAKSGGNNFAGMALPEEDGRIKRRSFELEREREAAGRYGTTRR